MKQITDINPVATRNSAIIGDFCRHRDMISSHVECVALMSKLLLRFKWWDKSIDEIDGLIPILTCSDLVKVKKELKARL